MFAITLYPEVAETFEFMVIGFVLVVGVLWIMSLMTSFIGLFFRNSDKPKTPGAPKAPASRPAPASKAGGGDSSTLAALISSAVYAATDGAPHRIVSVSPAAAIDTRTATVIAAAVAAVLDGSAFRISSVAPAAPDFNWANFGRCAIFASKSPRR